jgi:glucose/mannose transport system substrate-binding protein
VRQNVAMDTFDDCAKASARDFGQTAKAGTLVPSVAHGMALAPGQQAVMRKLVSDFWNNPQMSVNDTQKQLLALAAGPQKSPQ